MRRISTSASSTPPESGGRSSRPRGRLRVSPAILVGVAVVLVVAGFALGRVVFSAASGRMELIRSPQVQAGGVQAGRAEVESSMAAASASAGMVEVPELTGMRADEAVVVLETAGFRVGFRDVGQPVSDEASRVVASQEPSPGTVLSANSTVTISVPPFSGSATSTPRAAKKKQPPRGVVCIDPGHQAHSDAKLEPIGPGSKTEKPRATGGSTGVATGVPEHEVALQIAMNLQKRLEAAGIKVVMTRTTNDVRLSNSQRAKIANRAKADLFVRIHCGASTNPADCGVAAFYPAKNRWTGRIVARSRAAARKIESALARTTGSASRGAETQEGIAGFNWSRVPSVFVETGFLSNPMEDRLMSSPNHQDKVAEGISQGVLAYLDAEGL